jgi:hypothetical protein
VYLNFSGKTVPLDADAHPRMAAYSSLRDGAVRGDERRALRPWEAMVFLDEG